MAGSKEKKKENPGNIGTSAEDVVKEEPGFVDLEGGERLPVIDDKKKTSSPPRRFSVRIMGERVRLHPPGKAAKIFYRGDIIQNPWDDLIKLARIDTQGRVFRLIRIKD